jgi:Coenzyme PQQ synthesis protein D (PqqD)
VTLRYRRHPNIRLTALEGEGVVLHLDDRRYFTVNATGLTLLESLVEPRTMDELVAVLVREYQVAAPEASATAQAFLKQCTERGVVQTLEA